MSAAFIPQGLLIRYLDSLPEKKQELDTLFESFLRNVNEDAARDLRSAMHRLAGSTAMYGLDGLSNTIRAALRVVDSALENGSLPNSELLGQARLQIDQSWSVAAQEARQSIAEG